METREIKMIGPISMARLGLLFEFISGVIFVVYDTTILSIEQAQSCDSI